MKLIFRSLFARSAVVVLPLLLLPAVSLRLFTPIIACADMGNPSLQMATGNLDKATTSPTNKNHYLIQRAQYALSYNDGLRFPNWVAWHLSRSDIGSVERGKFQPDTSLPDGFTMVTPKDYTRSGYDRGHNCPSKDRSATRADNDSVFLMTNMTPQAHGMNAGPWEGLESYSRDLTNAGNELFIIAGHGFSSPTRKTIGKAKIAIPDFGWKVVVVIPVGPGTPISRITSTTRVIAIRVPNISTVSKKDWREYRTSVQDIESVTKLNFFDALPKSVVASLKNRVDFDQSAPSKRMNPVPPVTNAPTTPGLNSSTNPLVGTGQSGQVWVNTKSGAYWRPGTRYYGKTKQGKYMSEVDAIKAGYHAAGGQ
jgi:DNA/RNA endonuclease G (NUC1)